MAVNLNNTTPAAPLGNTNITWQKDTLGNASGYVPTGAGLSFADDETPSGAVDGVNDTFTLAETPNPAASLMFSVNGILWYRNVHYTLTGDTITADAGNIPQTGDLLRAWYRY